MTNRSLVPCGTCRACCRHEAVWLVEEEGDRPADYLVKTVDLGEQLGIVYALQQKPNGDCIYLGEAGCTIWDRAPVVCRAFDCRGWARKLFELGRSGRKAFFAADPKARDLYRIGMAKIQETKHGG